MSNEQYQYLPELIELVQQTGNPCLLMPSNNGKPLVLLTLENYRELLEKDSKTSIEKIDELAKELHNYFEKQKNSQLQTDEQNQQNRKRLDRNEPYTNIEEFEIKRRLYADLMDGYKTEPIFKS